MKRLFIILLLPSLCFGFSKIGTTYTTDGSLSDVNAAISDATDGDTIEIGVSGGSYTWGASNTYIDLNKAVTLKGFGAANTTITASSSSGTYGAGIIRCGASGWTIRDFTITLPSGTGNAITAIGAFGSISGWRVTGMTINGATTTPNGYSFYWNGACYGVIDHSTFNGGNGQDEQIWGNGPSNAWQTSASSIWGTANQVFVENCTFTGQGYCTDVGINGIITFRFNDIPAGYKVDGHGLASNPPRGVRFYECYKNHWSATTGFQTTAEMRGGTGVFWGNVIDDNQAQWVMFTDYGYRGQYIGFNFVYQTPNNYPIGDQIGNGPDVTIAATAISSYQNCIIASVGSTDFTAIGASANTVGTRFIATGAGTGTGTVTVCGSREPFYIWLNTHNGTQIVRTLASVASGAITLYGSTFTEKDLIHANRDIFADSGFDADGTGVSVGTKAAMLAYTPSITGYRWWVTDEGSWDTTLPANTSGRAYDWNGASWVLSYTPYTYPHPLTVTTGGSSIGGSATIGGNATGT